MFAKQLASLCKRFANESGLFVRVEYQVGDSAADCLIVYPEPQNDTQSSMEKKGAHYVIAMLMRYINENLHEDLSLSSLAEKANYHPSYLSRLFKHVAGTNPSDFILNARIDKAKELLIGGKFQVNKVAKQVGYASSHSFARVFKGMTGVSPQEYKNSKLSEGF